jgi:hypothetical protein
VGTIRHAKKPAIARGSRTAGCRKGLPTLLVRFAMLHLIVRIKIGLGRSDMAKRLASTVACVLSIFSIFVLSGLSAARAADPAFCKQYAQAALNQVRGGLANPGCAGRLQGARWSTDFAVHYEWCLGTSFGAVGAERDERTHFLRACTGH